MNGLRGGRRLEEKIDEEKGKEERIVADKEWVRREEGREKGEEGGEGEEEKKYVIDGKG